MGVPTSLLILFTGSLVCYTKTRNCAVMRGYDNFIRVVQIVMIYRTERHNLDHADARNGVEKLSIQKEIGRRTPGSSPDSKIASGLTRGQFPLLDAVFVVKILNVRKAFYP